MQRRSSATWLALIYLVLVVYASLYPFAPWRWPPSLGPSLPLHLPWPRYWLGFDIWANALGYVPLGAVWWAAVRRSGGSMRFALLLSLLGAPALSYLMETLQYFLPGRVPSLADWLLNTGGAWCGTFLAWLLQRWGALEHWHGWRERWFVPHSAGAMALLALWPAALLFPAPLPLGLGQWLPRLRGVVETLLQDTPWAWDAFEPDWTQSPLPPGLELMGVALGLLAPCLLALSIARPGWRRVVLVAGASTVGVLVTTASTAMNFGPQHAWTWVTAATWPGLALGAALALLAALMSRRANAAWGLVALTALVALVTEAPPDPYLTLSLKAWEQGRFINFYGLAQWLGWVWPFTALAWLMWAVTQRDNDGPGA